MQHDVLGMLEDIRDAIGFIAEDTDDVDYESFMRDRRRRQAVERNFEIMGEAINRLYRKAPNVAQNITGSRKIVNFRNALAHGYDTIDYLTVWEIIQESLPDTMCEIEEILREESKGP